MKKVDFYYGHTICSLEVPDDTPVAKVLEFQLQYQSFQ